MFHLIEMILSRCQKYGSQGNAIFFFVLIHKKKRTSNSMDKTPSALEEALNLDRIHANKRLRKWIKELDVAFEDDLYWKCFTLMNLTIILPIIFCPIWCKDDVWFSVIPPFSDALNELNFQEDHSFIMLKWWTDVRKHSVKRFTFNNNNNNVMKMGSPGKPGDTRIHYFFFLIPPTWQLSTPWFLCQFYSEMWKIISNFKTWLSISFPESYQREEGGLVIPGQSGSWKDSEL